jgi:ABC-2 type transport system ATP-binding protein
MDVIRTEGLTKQFGDFVAVDGVTLTVSEGEVLALLGPNGAGKTTTVRMLASILKPTSGWATIAGYDVVRDTRTVRRIVGLLTEFPGLYLRMRALEYLDFFGQLQGLSPQQRQQRSEELLAMDPHSAKLVRDCILDLRRERRTIIICTHNLAEAELLADRVAIIRRGQIVALGTLAELRARLLGDPVLELRLAQSLDGLLPLITDLVDVEECGETWLRYRTAQPEMINPILIQRLAREGTEVITLSKVLRSLEDVYLKIVEE